MTSTSGSDKNIPSAKTKSDGDSPYPHPAGGWGALKSSAKHIIKSEDAAKGVKTTAEC